MLPTVYGLMSKYDIDKVYIDGANPSFIRSLKLQIGEEADYDKVITRYRSEGLGDGTQDMKIVPVNFKEHKAMLGHCKMILERDGGTTLLKNWLHTMIYLMLLDLIKLNQLCIAIARTAHVYYTNPHLFISSTAFSMIRG